MSEKYKILDQGKIYYVTFTVVQWVDLFTRNEYRKIIIESLKYCQQEKGLVIYAYCIMTNHIHMIISSEWGVKLENIIRDFRGFTSKKLKKELIINPSESRKKWILAIFENEGKKRKSSRGFQLWKRNYHPIEISSKKFFDEKLEYIHQNPVKAGFVFEPHEYIFSSAVNYAGGMGVLDVVLASPE